MKIMIQLLLGLFVAFFLTTNIGVGDEYIYSTMINPSVVSTNDHFSDIRKHCSSFLSSASEYKPDDDARFRLYSDLSFQNGDWEQDIDGVPIMPFLDNEIQTPLKLASFDVKDVSLIQHFQNSVRIKGLLSIGMSRKPTFLHNFNSGQSFVTPGSSVLTFSFDGVYTETSQERSLCLLGNSTVPSLLIPQDIPNGFDFKMPNGFDFNPSDKFLLILRYPQCFSLHKRAIRGELTSVREQENPKDLDTVYISSQFRRQSRYEFSLKVLESSCDPNLYHDEMMEDGVQNFTSSELCHTLDYVSEQAISVFPNYKFGGRYLKGSELGGFLFGREIENVGSSYENVELVLQHVKCEYDTNGSAKISAVLRAIPAGINSNIAQTMTGFSGSTLTAEGMWDPSSGQVCMIGCPEGVDSGLKGCNSRISFYFPRTFSIKQRSMVFGSISSIKHGKYSKFHLLFDAVMHPAFLKHKDIPNYLSYNYSKFSLASVFKSTTQPFQIFTNLKQSFFKYPSLENGEKEPFSQFEILSEKLLVNGYLDPHQLADGYNSGISINMGFFSLGPLLGSFYRESSKQIAFNQEAKISSTDILNVSSHLVFRELNSYSYAGTMTSYKNISQLFLEGLYDPLVGEMHLIGCRKITIEGTNAERDLDCLIEVKILYPSDNMQWLINPIVKITITSQRNEHDPLHFVSISLHARMSKYQNSSETAAHRRIFEGILRILVLGVAIAIISSQLSYMTAHEDIIPFISPAMLGLQVLGYSLPLINGTEYLFNLKASEIYTTRYGGNPRYIMLSNTVDNIGRTLLLAALLLTARLFRMVSESKDNLKSRRPRYGNMLKDKLVLLASLTMYAFGFLLWIVNDNHHSQQLQAQKNAHATREMIIEEISMRNLEEFVMMVQDFFLLPQILSNLFWQMNVKSLRKTYYLGFTLLRLHMHLYDYIRDPVLNFKFQEYDFVNPSDGSSKFSKISVAAIIVMLAAVLHIQQNWKNKKLSLPPISEKFKVMSSKSTLHDKLFHKSLED